jgi:hypothetical protein
MTDTNDGYCWGADAIGKAIDRNRRQTYMLIENGYLPCVAKVGGIYFAPRAALKRQMNALAEQHEESAA